MKLPALWMVAALMAGIALAGPLALLPLLKPLLCLTLTSAVILVALGLLWFRRVVLAFALGLMAWCLLGVALVQRDQRARPANQVSRLVEQGRIDLGTPLRWRGRLRDDPMRLPWGYRYVLDLEEVELGGQSIPATGGLRVNYFHNPDRSEMPPALRAGDAVEALARARPPRNFGNPGALDYRAYLERENVHLTATLRSLELLRKLGDLPPTFAHRLSRARGRLLERLDSLFPAAPDRAAVLRAMLLGDRSFVDHERAEAFQKAAVYHVLVISGLNVAALVVFLFWLGHRLGLSLAPNTLLTLAVLAGYVGVVEDRPPILRAALMATAVLAARLLFRRVDFLNTVAVAALVILVASPSALTDPSFQLSFLAVGTMGALAAPWIRRTAEPYRGALSHLGDITRDAAHAPRAAQFRLDLRAAAAWLGRRLPGKLAGRATSLVSLPCAGALRLWEVLLFSATIQLGMLPLLAHYFHRVSLAGLLANVPAVVLTGFIVPLGFLTLSLGMAWLAGGAALAQALGFLVAALTVSVEWFARSDWASYRVPGPPNWLLASFFVAMILLTIGARIGRKKWQLWASVPLTLFAIGVATHPFAPRLEPGKLEVTVLDVGQGDSIFTAFPDGRTMLMDGGGVYGAGRIRGMRTSVDIGEGVVSPYLWSRGLKVLDVVALSHAHQDHLEGLDAVLKNFRVRELWVGRDVARPAYRALIALASARGVRVVHRIRGERFAWDGVRGQILWPERSNEAEDAENNDSLVLRLEHGQSSLLLPGDIEQAVEHALAAQDFPLATAFLKVPHHGSRTSTSAELLEGLRPRFAAISVGENNPFGHPHPGVLERLRSADVRVLRTDEQGAITVVSDAQTLQVRCFLKPECAGSH